MRLLLFLIFLPTIFYTQKVSQENIDSIFIRKVYDEALLRGRAYEDLRELCKNIGHRLSG